MAGLVLMEVVARLALALTKGVFKLWLNDSPVPEAVADDAVDSLKKRFGDAQTCRKGMLLFHGLQDEIADRLQAVLEVEFRAMPENDRLAAALEVENVFAKVGLSQEIFKADIDAMGLVKALTPHATPLFAPLGPEVAALAALLLRESCHYVVTLADKLPDFHLAATRELLKRHTELLAEMRLVMDGIAAIRRQFGEDKAREVAEFETEYTRALLQLDHLELFGLRIVGSGTRKYSLSVAYVTVSSTAAGTESPGGVDQHLADRARVLLAGEAGSGKTTLLQWLAVRAATRSFEGPLSSWNELAPFYVRLRDYADLNRPRDFPKPADLVAHFAPNVVGLMPGKWANQALAKGALLLVDGIDELPASRRHALYKWVKGMSEQFGRTRIVISSRPAAIDAVEAAPAASNSLSKELLALGFQRLMLEPMSLRGSEALVAQWHRAVARDLPNEHDRTELKKWETSLIQALRDRPAVLALASNPLLCAMICALNWDRRQRLPEQRMELYRLALDLLFETRDAEREIATEHEHLLNRAAKEDLLDSLAYWMLRNGHSEVTRKDAIDHLKEPLGRLAARDIPPEKVLQILLERSGVLRQPQPGIVDFIHRTFQEYMAARAAVNRNDRGALVQRAQDESWRETIVFAAGHAKHEARDRLVDELLRRPIMRFGPRAPEADVTAACCLETVGDNLRNDLLDKLQERARKLFPPKDFATARLLAPAAALSPALLRGHEHAPAAVVAACIRTASMIGGEAMLQVIESYARVDGEQVESELLRGWIAFDESAYRDRILKVRRSLCGIPIEALNNDMLSVMYLMSPSGAEPLASLVDEVMNFLVSGQLSFRGACLSMADARRIADIQSIRELTVFEREQGTLEILQRMPNLSTLKTWITHTSEVVLFGKFPKLTQLDAISSVSDLRALERSTSLIDLRVAFAGRSPCAIELLPMKLPLVKLSVEGFFGAGMAGLGKCRSLEKFRLVLSGSAHTIRSYDFAADLPKVAELDLELPPSPWSLRLPAALRRLSVKHCEHLDILNPGELANLEVLEFHGVFLTESAVRLFDVPFLRSLSLEFCKTAAGAKINPENHRQWDAVRRRGVVLHIR
jgi:hypothetical protein